MAVRLSGGWETVINCYVLGGWKTFRWLGDCNKLLCFRWVGDHGDQIQMYFPASYVEVIKPEEVDATMHVFPLADIRVGTVHSNTR